MIKWKRLPDRLIRRIHLLNCCYYGMRQISLGWGGCTIINKHVWFMWMGKVFFEKESEILEK